MNRKASELQQWKKTLKFLDATNATNLATSKQIVLQMKNGMKKMIRKGMMKEGPRKPTLHGTTMTHPTVQRRRSTF